MASAEEKASTSLEERVESKHRGGEIVEGGSGEKTHA